MPSDLPSAPANLIASPATPKTGKRPLYRWGAVAIGVVSALALLRLANRIYPAPRNLGVTDGRLAACPDSPNCVASQAEDATHRVEPLRFEAEPESTFARLKQVLSEIPGAVLREEHDRYLRYEFRTPVCGFRDDVEFLQDDVARVIHVRSASRIGYSDLGTNRRRIESLRTRLRG